MKVKIAAVNKLLLPLLRCKGSMCSLCARFCSCSGCRGRENFHGTASPGSPSHSWPGFNDWTRHKQTLREGETHSKAEATAPTSFTQGTHFVLELHRVSRIKNYISFKTLHFWKDFLVARNSGSLWYDLRLEHEAVEWITRRRFTLSELTWTIATLSVHVHRICCDHTAQV